MGGMGVENSGSDTKWLLHVDPPSSGDGKLRIHLVSLATSTQSMYKNRFTKLQMCIVTSFLLLLKNPKLDNWTGIFFLTLASKHLYTEVLYL